MRFRPYVSVLAAACALVAGLWITTAFGEKSSKDEKKSKARRVDDGPLDPTGTWTLNTWQHKARGMDGRVHIAFRFPSPRGENSHSQMVPIEALEGLPSGALAGSKTTVSFRLRRDSATFLCDGHVAAGKGAGLFEVELDPAFAAGFRERGIDEPSAREQVEMALGDVGFALIDELRSRGAEFQTQHLVKMARHGAGWSFVRGLEEAGHSPKSIDELIRTRDHGVTPDYIRELERAGFRALTLSALIRTRDHGVDGEFIEGLASYGFKNLELAELVKARDHGVDPDYIRGLREAGYEGLDLDELIQTRDHGVDPEYIAEMSAAGHERLSLGALVRARDHGVDGEYVEGLAKAGYRGLTLDQLIQARDHGVDGSFAREVRQKLGKAPTIEQLIRIRDRGGLED